MIELPPAVPPVYEPVCHRGPDAFAEACGRAVRAPRDGALLWTEREDLFDCALVLEPDLPEAQTLQVVYIATLALGDALSVLVPPALPVTFGWPDRIEVNGGSIGGIRLNWAPVREAEAPPSWLALGVTLRLAADWSDHSPGRDVHRTSLQEEGCTEMTSRDLLEAFARHFLSWMSRWQDDGFDPLRESWMARAGRYRKEETEEPGTARIVGIAEDGALQIVRGRRRATLPLAPALRRPSWRR